MRSSGDPRTGGGYIATLSDGTVIHRDGLRHDAALSIARYCDAHGLRVRSLSSPATVLRDLQGDRLTHGSAREIALPEPDILSRIGRLDLCMVRGVAPGLLAKELGSR